jgi:hypothetical protein
MQPTILAQFLALSGAALSMSAAGLSLLAIGLLVAKNDIAQARGIDKLVTLTHLCFAIPLAVFGAEHLSSPQSLLTWCHRTCRGVCFGYISSALR